VTVGCDGAVEGPAAWVGRPDRSSVTPVPASAGRAASGGGFAGGAVVFGSAAGGTGGGAVVLVRAAVCTGGAAVVPSRAAAGSGVGAVVRNGQADIRARAPAVLVASADDSAPASITSAPIIGRLSGVEIYQLGQLPPRAKKKAPLTSFCPTLSTIA
jgi:hypothetical protein